MEFLFFLILRVIQKHTTDHANELTIQHLFQIFSNMNFEMAKDKGNLQPKILGLINLKMMTNLTHISKPLKKTPSPIKYP